MNWLIQKKIMINNAAPKQMLLGSEDKIIIFEAK